VNEDNRLAGAVVLVVEVDVAGVFLPDSNVRHWFSPSFLVAVQVEVEWQVRYKSPKNQGCGRLL
jgi:hypothetical protein